MKNPALCLLLFLLAMPALAQTDKRSSYNRDKFESAKVAFITQRIDLTPDQAEKFWPLYHQHNEKKAALMKSMHELVKPGEREISNREASELIDKKFKMEQEILDMEKAFLKEIVKVISPVQALKVGDANRSFTRHIYHMQKKKKNGSE